MNSTQEIRQIELARLLPHPKNANVMPPATMNKVRRHIERTGRYEPLVVRPHPTHADCFELINGHHRKEILASLGHTHAACVVWPLNDAEALLLLATVNRLSGEDSPTKRLTLLEELSTEMQAHAADLALLLPEEEATLTRLLAHDVVQKIEEAPDTHLMPEALTLFFPAEEKRHILTVLKRTHRDPATALRQWTTEKEKTL
jgi:ParB-like chromosome segregation protein Spo0J